MRRLRPSSTAEMIATFLRQEVASARFGAQVRTHLAEAGLPEALVTRPDLRDRRANWERRRLLAAYRGYGTAAEADAYLSGFPTAGVRWAWWALAPAELLAARYIDWDYWLELSGGTRRPLDAAARIQAGETPYEVSNDGAWAMANAVRAGVALPPLIFVTAHAAAPDADLVVLEGHLRLTGYALAYVLAADALPPQVEVLVGASPAVRRWPNY